ncbi:hypothetical protein DFH07DRAFT_805816 [Mycena maculata]|uniref:DUF6534 domain-containing protein n=1 Tax=Mycena maculata TaxID=230809 RepID=A0AAD7JSI1_9AGAR|nr:hypothetical protein DFH07DRAFT_805816 [Mycena maculata]
MAPLPDVHLTYGPMLIGVFLNMILYGVFLSQVLTYHTLFSHPPTDGPLMACFITYLLVLETANTALDMAMLYQPLILDYGRAPLMFPSVFLTEPMLVVLVSTPIQLFFAWRISQITKCRTVPALIVVLALTSLAGGLYTSARVALLKLFALKPHLHAGALVWFLASCVADVAITVTLVLTLSNRKTGFAATDGVIDRIIRTTIQTGLVTSLFSILDVVCFMVFPHYSINFIFDLPLSKLYSNALLSTLNARRRPPPTGGANAGSHSVAYPCPEDDADGWISSDAPHGRWRWPWASSARAGDRGDVADSGRWGILTTAPHHSRSRPRIASTT